MSVQKFVIGQKKGGFTVVSNNVIQGLKDYALRGLYLYLSSLPPGWEFYKKHLQKEGNIGRDKLDKMLAKLEGHKLIKSAQIRDNKGRFSHFIMDVLDGTEFTNNELENKVELSTEPCPEKPLTDNRLLVNSTYKRNTDKQNKETKKTKSFCVPPVEKPKSPKPRKPPMTRSTMKAENERKHDFASSMSNSSRNTQKTEPQRPRLRDFTQERLEAESRGERPSRSKTSGVPCHLRDFLPSNLRRQLSTKTVDNTVHHIE